VISAEELLADAEPVHVPAIFAAMVGFAAESEKAELGASLFESLWHATIVAMAPTQR
jgi:hypothetical protein